MQIVEAQALTTQNNFQNGSEVAQIVFRFGKLSIWVRDVKEAIILLVEFDCIHGFRVLDERDQMEYWPVCSSQNGWLFEIFSGGWLSQEKDRPGSFVADMNPMAQEYFISGVDDCVSIISSVNPTIRSVGSIEQPQTDDLSPHSSE